MSALAIESRAPHERAHDAVVRHDDERVPADVLDRARERGVDAREQLRVVLAAGRRGELAPAPRLAHAGPARLDLGARCGPATRRRCVRAGPRRGRPGARGGRAMISAVRAARPRSEV